MIAVASLALAACHDAPTTPAVVDTSATMAPQAAALVAPPSTSLAMARLEALRDALVRVQPSLVPDERAAAVATGLRQAIAALEKQDTKGADKAFSALENTLERYSRNDRAQWTDVEVIRLAVRAASRR